MMPEDETFAEILAAIHILLRPQHYPSWKLNPAFRVPYRPTGCSCQSGTYFAFTLFDPRKVHQQ
jgi:hypothetical protein